MRSALSSAGRHTVYIDELDKTVGLKPSNLRYEPISLESLSIRQLKMVLKYKNQPTDDTVGMEKSELASRVSKLIASSDELPEILAKAKSNARESVSSTTSTSYTASSAQAAQAADQLSNMSPDQLRQQARMMRTMDPATVRRMNPQLANMSDAQIKMAADQMEMMANNPSMMKMASQQMKNMDPAQLQEMQAKMAQGGSNTSNTASTAASISQPTPSVNQAQHAAQMMENMNPEQLRQQAFMLKTMDPDMLRRTNPQLAHMSDAQIKMAATQFEMMASNPAMMKLATDHMKNATPEQLEAMKKGQVPTPGTSSNPAGTPNAPQMGGDPMEMLTNMDKTQLKEMFNTVKQNPEMLKQYAGMCGISEEQLIQGVEGFASMDESKIDALLKMVKMAKTAKETWSKVDVKTGGNLKSILVVLVVSFVVWIVRYFFFSGQTAASVDSTIFSNDQYYTSGDDVEESEF